MVKALCFLALSRATFLACNTPTAMPPGVVSPASISKVLPGLAVAGGLLGCVLWVFLCMGAVSEWGCALAMAFKAARWIWN